MCRQTKQCQGPGESKEMHHAVVGCRAALQAASCTSVRALVVILCVEPGILSHILHLLRGRPDQHGACGRKEERKRTTDQRRGQDRKHGSTLGREGCRGEWKTQRRHTDQDRVDAARGVGRRVLSQSRARRRAVAQGRRDGPRRPCRAT